MSHLNDPDQNKPVPEDKWMDMIYQTSKQYAPILINIASFCVLWASYLITHLVFNHIFWLLQDPSADTQP